MNNTNEVKTVSASVANAIRNIPNSTFALLKDNYGNYYFNVKNATVIWPNFGGTPFGDARNADLDQFGKGKRSFNLVLNEEYAKKLKDLGWNVKERVTNDPDYPVLSYIKVNVTIHHPYTFDKQAAFPSNIYLVTNFNGKENSEQLIDDDISRIDGRRRTNDDPQINIKKIDCSLRSRRYNVGNIPNGKQRTAVYLANMFVYAEEISMFSDPHEEELARNAVRADAPTSVPSK